MQCVAATGSTGAGATPKRATHHPERLVNLKAYKVFRHQHTPEVETWLRTMGDFERLHFVPLSAPLDRGILATCFLRTVDDSIDPTELLAKAYEHDPLVRVRSEPPQLRHVRGTGLCHLSATRDGDQVAVLSAIDNLGKGAAAHAVQCFNHAVGMVPGTAVPSVPCLP